MPATATYSSTGNVYVDGVLSGVKWAVSSLTFSFPTDPAFYGSNYGGGETNNNFKAFTSVQQGAVRSILQMYASVVNVTFTEVTETSSQHGDLRLAESDSPGTAWGYNPSPADQRTTPEINGTVSQVAADITVDQHTGQGYYTIDIATRPEEIARLGAVKLVPGMPVEAFIKTHDRRVISYLVKPLRDQIARAFRE